LDAEEQPATLRQIDAIMMEARIVPFPRGGGKLCRGARHHKRNGGFFPPFPSFGVSWVPAVHEKHGSAMTRE
jgi:hypothetical protein